MNVTKGCLDVICKKIISFVDGQDVFRFAMMQNAQFFKGFSYCNMIPLVAVFQTQKATASPTRSFQIEGLLIL